MHVTEVMALTQQVEVCLCEGIEGKRVCGAGEVQIGAGGMKDVAVNAAKVGRSAKAD